MNALRSDNSPDHSGQLQFALLRLSSWPSITELPPHLMVDVARICALLAWRATAGMLVARILDMPKERVEEVLLLLRSNGCLSVGALPAGSSPNSQPSLEAANDDGPVSQPAAHDSTSTQSTNSFIHKIWRHLSLSA